MTKKQKKRSSSTGGGMYRIEDVGEWSNLHEAKQIAMCIACGIRGMGLPNVVLEEFKDGAWTFYSEFTAEKEPVWNEDFPSVKSN